MEIEFDANKRDKTLTERGLDFARASDVFAGRHFTVEDTREDYGESRYITVGKVDGRMVIIVWTPRGEARRIVSMRKANDREQTRYAYRVG
ncbi:BrnT family toxin [Trinickia sp. LjRoot230]|uniref:BrnT family toxin n=1 Tax=Trinickia sp. LjRoot230 TaxID=3342288 RepID=UPI003ECD0714